MPYHFFVFSYLLSVELLQLFSSLTSPCSVPQSAVAQRMVRRPEVLVIRGASAIRFKFSKAYRYKYFLYLAIKNQNLFITRVLPIINPFQTKEIFMIATLTGYPRIGRNRELKFALEKYFRKEITWRELAATAADLRAENFRTPAMTAKG